VGPEDEVCEGFQMLAGRDGVAGCTAGV